MMPQTPGTLIARSMQDLDTKITQVSQPQPRWSMPLAIVLVLLCAEGLLSNETADLEVVWPQRNLTSTRQRSPAVPDRSWPVARIGAYRPTSSL